MELSPKSLSKTYYRLRRLSRRLWIRATMIATLAVIASLAAPLLSLLIPDGMDDRFEASSVTSILTILAQTMLSVTVFSLTVMVSARQSASTQVTPRSHQLLLEDTTTQTVLATFLGAFIFSLVGLVELTTGYYSGAETAVMLFFTLLVIGLVVVAILRWIAHLTELGSVVETTRKVERATQEALRTRIDWPCLGARALSEGHREIPAGAAAYRAWMTGYVQHVDVGALSDLAKERHASIYVVAPPGKFVTEGAVLAWHTGSFEDGLRDGFTLGDTRVFGQDPRFGVIVLSEIAQRALSPGINDPGTAIDVLGRLQRLLVPYRDEGRRDRPEPAHPRIWMEPVTAEALVRDSFDPISRDGAGMIEVQLRLQVALRHLIDHSDGALAAAARAAAERSLARAEEGLTLEADLRRLHAKAGEVVTTAENAA